MKSSSTFNVFAVGVDRGLYRAGDAIRTRDINLGKIALYHWATPAFYFTFKKYYIRRWYSKFAANVFNTINKNCNIDPELEPNPFHALKNLNPRHQALETYVLPTELRAHRQIRWFSSIKIIWSMFLKYYNTLTKKLKNYRFFVKKNA